MRVNIFRIGRWLIGVIIAIWIAGCIRDAVNLDILSAGWSLILIAIGFTIVGVAVIIGAAWGIGWFMRRLLNVPPGQDFHRDSETQAF